MTARLKMLINVLLLITLVATTLAQESSLVVAAKSALATTSGTLQIRGLMKPVSVRRDRWGVAHIYAQNQHDLFFAQGVVAAQDRLFQMEMWKRAGQGRLAEVLGPSALQRDIRARLLRYRGDMKAEYESYSPDTREILEAFTSGINSYISTLEGQGGPGLPIEFRLAGFRPTPWTPEDCLNRMAAFSMTNNAFAELYHAQLVALLGKQQATQLLDLDPAVELDPAGNIDFTGLSPALLKDLIGSDMRIEFPARAREGSNNWTISGTMTKSGKPLVANDPHRVIGMPSLRYMVHLVAPGWDVIGAGEPGLPGVALGHNQHIGWGFTIFGLDQQDLYLEELNPADSNQYRTKSGWQKMTVETESIPVKGAAPVVTELKFTRHGPVVWTDNKRALALRWIGMEPGTAGYLGSLALDRATDWKDFEAGVSRWKVPSENLVYGDTDGNIGEYSVGLSPVRKNWTGLLPVPGAGGFEWSGFIPYEQLPHSFNPRSGFIVTANHKMIPPKYPYNVGFEWAAPYRFERITGLLEKARDSKTKLTPLDLGQIQSDVESTPARHLVSLLRGNPRDQDAYTRLLTTWNYSLDRESPAAALYEVWIQELTKAFINVAIPQKAREAVTDLPMPLLIRQLEKPSPAIFGNIPTQSRDALLLESLQKAAQKLTKLQGSDASKWSWGALHVVRFRHSLDQQPGAADLFDLGSLPRLGDETTVNATGYSGDSFWQTSGASYREILDTSNWDQSLAINSPGQSGQPGSTHYFDLMKMWDAGQYFPLAYSKEAVERETRDVLELIP
jgi:penicillin G amidase